MNDIKKICKNLKLAILAQGFTVEQVCKKAGITKQAFYAWVRGDREPLLSSFNAVVQSYNKLKRNKYNGEKRQEKKER